MIEILTENLAAGELKTFVMQGEYLEILDAQYPLDVYLMDRSGGQISTMRKAEASFFSRPGRFECIQLQSTTAQTVRFFVGSGDAGTRRSAGVVQVVDGGLARTRGGSAFSSGASLNPATVTNNAGLQLWNSASAGGRSLVVEQVSAFCNVAGVGLNLRLDTVQLGAVSGFAASKLAGGADSTIAQLRTQEGTAWSGKTIGTLAVPTSLSLQTFVPKEPIVLPPGYGLAVIDTGTANHTTWVNFEHYEVA